MTIKEGAEYLGIGLQAMYRRYRKYNDDPVIFTKGLQIHPLKPRKVELVIGGEEHSKEEWERITGLPWHRLRGRRNRGNSMEGILSKKPLSRGRKILVAFNGETHCQTEWARILGISRERVSQRLKAFPVEEALGMVKHQRSFPKHNKTYRGKPTKRTSQLG